MPGHLDGFLQLTLMVCAGPCHSPRHNLAPLSYERFKEPRVFVINCQVRVLAESANLPSYIDPLSR